MNKIDIDIYFFVNLLILLCPQSEKMTEQMDSQIEFSPEAYIEAEF